MKRSGGSIASSALPFNTRATCPCDFGISGLQPGRRIFFVKASNRVCPLSDSPRPAAKGQPCSQHPVRHDQLSQENAAGRHALERQQQAGRLSRQALAGLQQGSEQLQALKWMQRWVECARRGKLLACHWRRCRHLRLPRCNSPPACRLCGPRPAGFRHTAGAAGAAAAL